MKLTLATIFLATCFLLSCGGSGGETDNGDGDSGTGTIQGTVQDSNRRAVTSATVVVVGKDLSAITNEAGLFQIASIPVEDRILFKASSSGYLDSFKTLAVVKDQTTYITVDLPEAGATATVSAATGGTVTDADIGASISIDPGTLTVSGSVQVGVANLSPTGDAFPGFEAVSTENADEVSALESYGAISCAIWQDGEAVDAEFTGTATIPIPSDSVDNAPDTVNFWAFNETTGLWESAGTGTKTACGDTYCYSGAITHCSNWTAGSEFGKTYVRGTVRNGSGSAVAGVMVVCSGLTYFGSGFTVTDASGEFTCFVKHDPNGGVQFYVYARGASGDGVSVGPLDAPTNQYTPSTAVDIGEVQYTGQPTVDFLQLEVTTSIWADWTGEIDRDEDGRWDELLDLDLIVKCPNGYTVYNDVFRMGSLVEPPYLLLKYDGDENGPLYAEVNGYYDLPVGSYEVYLYVHTGESLVLFDNVFMYAEANIWNHLTQTGANDSTSTDESGVGVEDNAWHALTINVESGGLYSVTTVNQFLTCNSFTSCF